MRQAELWASLTGCEACCTQCATAAALLSCLGRDHPPPQQHSQAKLVADLIGSDPSLQVASVNKFDSKSSLGLADGVKSLHVLPFFTTFASLATRLEDLLAGGLLWAHTLEAWGAYKALMVLSRGVQPAMPPRCGIRLPGG